MNRIAARGNFEGMILFQTLAEPGEDYPAVPEYDTLNQDILDAPNVWYVREMTGFSFTSGDTPDLTAIDTGKRDYLMLMGNGPVLGGPLTVESYLSESRGMTRTYMREGSYIMGWYSNGQLFGFPLIKQAGCVYCQRKMKRDSLQWQVKVPPVDAYFIKSTEAIYTLDHDAYYGRPSAMGPTDAATYDHLTASGAGTDPGTGATTRVGYELCDAAAYALPSNAIDAGTGWAAAAVGWAASHPGFAYNYVNANSAQWVYLFHLKLRRRIWVGQSVYIGEVSAGGDTIYTSYSFLSAYESFDLSCNIDDWQTWNRVGGTGAAKITQENHAPGDGYGNSFGYDYIIGGTSGFSSTDEDFAENYRIHDITDQQLPSSIEVRMVD